ncbi:ThuA domain-containing protein [Alteromonas stellipolaris]|uniref:ThuA domain-containing protein n=1 Tax=Alteromonas stellipolaris TaxID=233316 RepID=UPI0026E3D175|nr:ThuA domain-containing protein [Alteromonas stellipolaris]MDO6537293.1 ThuA domain-containing protein [Alteromonas stellipolaris]
MLIVDGQNNHPIWPKSTAMMKAFLERNGQFVVDVYRTQYTWRGDKWLEQYPANDGREHQSMSQAKTDPSFSPDFAQYDVVISNFGWKAAPWPPATQRKFEQYMQNGGGFVSVHAANNAFPNWLEYNKMIGLGGWGGRNQKDGPYIYYNDDGELQRDMSAGQGGGHGYIHEFTIQVRHATHPIMQGLPSNWLHSKDELYNRLRGPAENLTVLASAYDNKKYNGYGRHEPVIMTVDYHQGRVFHTTMGHGEAVYSDPTFMSILAKGVAWAAGTNHEGLR